MTIVPSGKTRIMVAQNFSTPGYGGEPSIDTAKPALEPEASPVPMDSAEPDPQLETGDILDEDLGGEAPGAVNDDVTMGDEEQDVVAPQDKGRKTLTTYIFEKLQNYGYPGRRLQDFKSEFVKESVSPEGVKDIEVVIPDKKYPDERGFTDTIENEELKEVSHEVNKMFGLNFNGADRAGGKWTIKFTSADLGNPEEENMARDSLDQVYGTPNKGGKSDSPGSGDPGQKPSVQAPTQRAASTIREMIKDQKNDIVSKLKNAIGD